MQKEKQKLLDFLKQRGYKSEAEILKIGLSEVASIGPLSWRQILLLAELQRAIKSEKVLSWLIGETDRPAAEK